MRKALVVGIDYYTNVVCLHGCVADARAMKAALERHGDGTVNYGVRLLTGSDTSDGVTRAALKEAIRELFAGESSSAFFYFAGHGFIEETGGYLVASDCAGDDGVPLAEVLTLANKSRARSKIVMLDSCYSGIAAAHPSMPQVSEVSEGVTILTASTAEQYATEENGRGVFTTLLVDALGGSAANLVGDITPGSVYAHIDQSLGPWEQRPVFKTNVKTFVSLRKVEPAITVHDLQRITELFPDPDRDYPLDPSFEPDSGSPHPLHTERFAVLQRYNRVNLVVPVGATHMYYAAMESKACKLTVLGRHYHRLVKNGRI